ncbi:hypothetical protein GCM10011487_11580 [Steroidobacter agaridevorans]|uniref:Uncharacterized protein n=1 Tax=Steroidobacter agaridevorans TaxID=2695856 RepID=A0A829Y8F9_9GAMM|nr:hypothetical protein GCM10011487_11580 [Steroidobacter agaridevorans]
MFRRHVHQNERTTDRILQLQARRFDGRTCLEVQRAARTLHAQALADRGRYPDSYVAIDKDHAFLPDHQADREWQSLPSKDLYGMADRSNAKQERAEEDRMLHDVPSDVPGSPERSGVAGAGDAIRCGGVL